MTSSNIHSEFILPLCVYTYEDSTTNTYLGYIGLPEINKLQNGTFSYKCGAEVPEYFGWKYKHTFYVISPFIRPIPTGMRLYCSVINKGFPYNTTDVLDVYDPYQPFENCINFITYSEPVPNTKALYLHKTGKDSNDMPSCFPSFDPIPPKGYQNNIFGTSVIYVMTPETILSSDFFNIQFSCINGRCLPWGKTEYGYPKFSLLDCIIQCNQIGNKNKPHSILEIIRDNNLEFEHSEHSEHAENNNMNDIINKWLKKLSSINSKYLNNERHYCYLFFIMIIIILLIIYNYNHNR